MESTGLKLFLALLGSGIFAAIAAIVSPVVVEKLKRKYKKEDKKEQETEEVNDISADIKDLKQDIKEYKNETSSQIENLRDSTERQFQIYNDKLSANTELTNSLVKNEISRTYINIRKKASIAIKLGKITLSEKESLMQEYSRYKKLPNANGFLDDTMETVKQLKVVVEDDDLV